MAHKYSHFTLQLLLETSVCEQDRQEGGVARVVTREPGAFRGVERDKFFIFSLFSVSQ